MSTTHNPTVTLKLSCGHVVPAAGPDTPAVGDPVGCEKCDRRKDQTLSVRRVKAVLAAPVTEAGEKTAAGTTVTKVTRASKAADTKAAAAAVADALTAAVEDAAHPAPSGHPAPEAPKAETKRGPRVVAASREAKALKAWTDGGEKGDRPATPNLDAIEAENGTNGDHGRPAPSGKPRRTPADPTALGLAQGPTGMVDSTDMTPDDPTPARRRRTRNADTASGGRVTGLNLSPVRRAAMLRALPEKPDGTLEDVASVVQLRTQVAADAKHVDVDAAGVRALLTGLAPLCAAGDKPACRLNDWVSKYADEVGWKPAEA